MGVQKKHGKGRLDKWYKLAKEKGYRARAAFKLIQLNRKYGFLEKSKVLLDLCAAPGSWCQVASENMPPNSLIVGVDIAPIKPIPRTITFQSDITKDKCRATIRQHFKTWKADTVLHDGAPNVGTAWVQDAFSQAELALQAMKLATEFLVEGGTFITKVFRSKDYNALLWVFNQLFLKVEATKPPSSRNVSAEIFVVCRGFKAPKRIDPKFLDPRSVFAELTDPTPNNEAKVFNPEKKKRKRDGYEEGDYTQFKEATASEFIQTTDPIAMLGGLNKLNFEQKENGDIALAALSRLPETTKEVRDCCTDLKVLGRKEFRILLRWRLKARERFGLAIKKTTLQKKEGDEIAIVAPMDEELRIQEELQQLSESGNSRRKRERRRENEKKQREIVRMQLHMMPPTEIGLEQAGPNGDDAMFALSMVDRAGAVKRILNGEMRLTAQPQTPAENPYDTDRDDFSDREEDQLERELDVLYQRYQEQKLNSNTKLRAKARIEKTDENWEGLSQHSEKSDDELQGDQDSNMTSESENGNEPINLIKTLESSKPGKGVLSRRAAIFFDQDVFNDIKALEAEADQDSAFAIDNDENEELDNSKKQIAQLAKATKCEVEMKTGVPQLGFDIMSSNFKGATSNPYSDSHSQSTIEDEDTEQNFEVVKGTGGSDWDVQGEPRKDGRLDIDIITAEAMTLAQQIASGQKSSYEVIDEGFNKYTFQDKDGLPEWFLDDEGRHSKPHRPITAAGAAAIKEKLRALNARPIKKVREAKDRKKFKIAQRMEKLRKKSALLADEEGTTEKDKAQNIAKLMSKAGKKRPKQQVKVVVAKGGNRGISGRPRGVKGKYKIVDARLKKDVRADKRLAQKRR